MAPHPLATLRYAARWDEAAARPTPTRISAFTAACVSKAIDQQRTTARRDADYGRPLIGRGGLPPSPRDARDAEDEPHSAGVHHPRLSPAADGVPGTHTDADGAALRCRV